MGESRTRVGGGGGGGRTVSMHLLSHTPCVFLSPKPPLALSLPPSPSLPQVLYWAHASVLKESPASMVGATFGVLSAVNACPFGR